MPKNTPLNAEVLAPSTRQASECALPPSAHSARGSLRNIETVSAQKEAVILGKLPNGETPGSGQQNPTDRLQLKRVPKEEASEFALDANAQLEKLRASERKADTGIPDDTKLKAMDARLRAGKGPTL